MGTYVTQSAFSVSSDKKTKAGEKIKRPPLRQFFMDGDFSLAGPLATALTKQALRFWEICRDPRKQNVGNFYERKVCKFAVNGIVLVPRLTCKPALNTLFSAIKMIPVLIEISF